MHCIDAETGRWRCSTCSGATCRQGAAEGEGPAAVVSPPWVIRAPWAAAAATIVRAPRAPGPRAEIRHHTKSHRPPKPPSHNLPGPLVCSSRSILAHPSCNLLVYHRPHHHPLYASDLRRRVLHSSPTPSKLKRSKPCFAIITSGLGRGDRET